MTEPEKSVKRETRHAIIYFNAGSANIMKDLAKKIRAEGGKTTMVDSSRWNGPENMLPEAKAVVIEIDCANCDEIRDTYQQLANDVEVHFVDHDGDFVVDEDEDTALSGSIEPDDTTDQNGDGSSDDESEDETGEDIRDTDSAVQAESASEGVEGINSGADSEPVDTGDGGETGDDEVPDEARSETGTSSDRLED